MSLILILKLGIVILFLVMFLRRPSLPWGVGLLVVTTAVLLDTILGTFNRELLLAQLGFFFYVIAGMLLGGGAFCILGLLWPHLNQPEVAGVTAVATPTITAPSTNGQPVPFETVTDASGAVYDLGMIYQDLHDRFGREDLLDLMFDLEMPESVIMPVNQNLDELSRAIINYAAQQGQTAALALAVERILTPPAPETLPRLEKMTAASPRAGLRYYLLSHYNLEKLQKLAAQLGIDWEQLEGTEKRAKVRELLLYLYRRNRVDELLSEMRAGVEVSSEQ
jgi:hypothetical protein